MALEVADQKYQRKGIYTTPLKALSNQKYTELLPRFGRSRVGLSTGDISINKGADMTVMTTEVYRNLAWRADSVASADEYTLEETAVVVFDEFHYMGVPGRGGVWEESVITSPSHIQIVALSATLSNAEQLASWIETVTQRKTILVQVPAYKRPVPLRYLYCSKDGLYPLFRDPDAGPGAPNGLLGLRGDGIAPDRSKQTSDKKGFGNDEILPESSKLPRGLQVNPMLKAAAEKRLQRVNRAMERAKLRPTSLPPKRRQRLFDLEEDDRFNGPSRRMSPREERKERERLLKKEMRRSVPTLQGIVNRLKQKDLLPAIFFIFSRAGCDNAAQTLYNCMKGPRDPNGLLDDEYDQFEVSEREKPIFTSKRKTRQRGQWREDIIEDSEGRSFRARSSYIREELLAELFEAATTETANDDELSESTPLTTDNYEFYTKAGLNNLKQVREVAARIAKFNEENPEIAFDEEIIEQYMFGVGSHHAGMLPAHKSFVELLYRNQLMKVVFSTETLAAGINMPARTTVICALAKRGDSSSMTLLETSNLLQMAGRAGRRGMDTDGTCVIVATPFEDHDDAVKILTNPIKPISSQFRPSYSLAVNLISRGEGRLDVARQLVSKSFAMWEKNQVDKSIASTIDNHGDEVSEVLQAASQERFLGSLAEILQIQIEKRRAKFDISRLQSLLQVLTNRETLKKTSKSYIGAMQMLELEKTTLGYLELELASLLEAASASEINDIPMINGDITDEQDLLNQIDVQRKRTNQTEKEAAKHPFSLLAQIANDLMGESTPEAELLKASLRDARHGQPNVTSLTLTADELSSFSKSAVVIGRKTRKLATSNPDLNTTSLLALAAEQTDSNRNDAWNDMVSIAKTLLAYGCISSSEAEPFAEETAIEDQEFTLTPAGVNVGMLGFENSLWALVAVGGAWDVSSASSKLDEFRDSLDKVFESDETDWYDDSDISKLKQSDIPKSQQEAQKLSALLQDLSASEIAGYIASVISDGSRTLGPSVVDLFQRLTPPQQRVIQNALLSMERLAEVQKLYGVDESTRTCTL